MVSIFHFKIDGHVVLKLKTRLDPLNLNVPNFLGVVLPAGMDDAVNILYIISEKNQNQTTGSVDGLVFAKVSHGNWAMLNILGKIRNLMSF